MDRTRTTLNEKRELMPESDSSTNRQKLIVELSGLTKLARAVINNEPLVILYFPFRLGRLSRTDLLSSSQQDLLLPDIQPYSVSRNHIVFEKTDETIFIVEEGSTCGTIIDNNYSRKQGIKTRTELSPGDHTIAIGGPESPFLFQVTVRAMQPADYLILDGNLPDRLPQARMLYEKLCTYEHYILTNHQLTPKELRSAAEGMTRAILNRPDLMELLRCLASNPILGENHVAQHSVNVAIFSIIFYAGMKFSPQEIHQVSTAALLHDIGMHHIDPKLLYKAGTLTKEELKEVQKHTTIGSELLNSTSDVDECSVMLARDHHERVNRTGYPRGTNVLPDITRYFGLIDSFELMTHDQPQRQAITPHEAIRALVGNGNDSFDAETRKSFLNSFSYFPVSTMVRLSSGEIGQVVGINHGHPFSPSVRVLFSSNGQPQTSGRMINLQQDSCICIVKEVNDQTFSREHAVTCSQGLLA